MTAPNRMIRKLRRELERELRELPAPSPPAGLLDAIRREIPAELAPAKDEPGGGAATPTPWRRRPLFRLAASLAVVAIGLALALRVGERPAPSDTPSSKTVRIESAPLAPAETAEASSASSSAASSSEIKKEEDSLKGKKERQRNLDGRASTANSATPPPSTESLSSLSGTPRGRRVESADVGQAAAAAPAPPAPAAAGAELRAEVGPPAMAQAKSAPTIAEPPASEVRLDSLGYVAGGEDRRVAAEAPAIESEPGTSESPTFAPTRRRSVEGRIPPPSAPSTGGTAEPLDRTAGDMFFRPTGTNPFVDAAEDPQSTFALDVDTGSWTLARNYLDRGALPPAEAIRVEELVNAQPYDDPAPRRGDFTLVAEGAPSPFAPAGDYRLLRFAVKARELDFAARRPAVLTFVVDVSGSMNRENRLALVKRALGLLLDELAPEDRVGLVVYGTRGRVVLRHTRDLEAIRDAIAALRPEGSTNAEEGLALGYDLAGEGYRSGASNRVILCSDGVANVGATGPESILARIGREARRGIELTTVGFGMGNYNDALMEQLADQGDGRYHYVDSLEEARRIFVENLTGTLETIAKDAKAQVEFDPRTVERWRLLGYENRDVADRDFRNDRVDAGEIGAGHSAVALYEVRLSPRARSADRLGTLRLRWKSTASGRVEEAALDLRLRDLEDSFASATGNLRRAAIAAELAEMLKGSFYAREASWSALAREADRLDRESRGRASRDLAALVSRAAELSGERPGIDRRPRGEEDDER